MTPNDLFAGDVVPVPAAGDYVAGDSDAAVEGAAMTLSLDDLLPDGSGEIVFDGDMGGPVQLVTGDTPVASGVVEGHHVTASGVDVAGYAFHAFASGVTLYLGDGAQVSLDAG